MWERIREWLGRGGSEASGGAVRATERVPDLLRAVFDAPDRADLRSVYADWLVERSDPLGELINLELLGGHPEALERAYSEHLPSVLGALSPILQGTRYQLGLPVEGVVSGGRPDLLAHPQWSVMRHIQSADRAVCGALASRVRSLHVVGEEALWGAAMATDSIVDCLQISGPIDTMPELRIDTVLLGSGMDRERVVELLNSPVRRLHLGGQAAPDPDLLKQLRAHPTLISCSWNGGGWGDGVPRPRALWTTPPLPSSLIPFRRVLQGGTRELWRVHDRGRGAGLLAGIRTRPGELKLAAEVVRPIAVIGVEPVVELYVDELLPLGPRPWTRATADKVEALSDRLRTAVEGYVVEDSLRQFFWRGSELVALAPVVSDTTVE